MNVVIVLLGLLLLMFIGLQKNKVDNAIQEIHEEEERNNATTASKIVDINNSLDDALKKIVLFNETSQHNLQSAIERITNENNELNKRIIDLSNEIQKALDDNQALKKKLAFYTEIGDDSKKLNEDVDENKQKDLILKALDELSATNHIPADDQKPQIKENDEKTALEPMGRESTAGDAAVLDIEQKAAFRIMSDSKQNLFITGKAGTGKSFLLKLFVAGNKTKNIILLAPTGVAAINIGGVTIHSAFGYENLVNANFEDIKRGKIRLFNIKKAVLISVDTIIIDEISMVRADTFEKMDLILRSLTHIDKPFGGKQIIIFGDLFQLPPIVTSNEESRFLRDAFGGVYFFQSNAYKNANFQFIELTINHRQKDDESFFRILNEIREGKIDDKCLSVLNSRMLFDNEQLRRVIRLFPKKADAERVNKEELERIDAKEYIYEAETKCLKPNVTRPLNEGNFPISKTLRLKVGALIMMVANDHERKWVNGTLGIVSWLSEECIKVTIQGVEYEVEKYAFKEQEATYEDGKIIYETVLEVDQYPIILAYAITIHKSQGMTYKQVACDIGDCFAPGQAYVALSRCSSLNGLFMLGKVNSKLLRVDSSVKEFYLREKSQIL